MSRLIQSVKLDTQMQVRNYLYHIAIGAAVLAGVGMAYFFDRETLEVAIPLFLLFASGATGYLFVGALILFEKREHTLDSLIVTPLRPREYILSKLITMTAIAIAESLVVMGVAYIWLHGWGFNWLWFLLGTIFMALMYTMVGFAFVVRHDSINNFLIPSVLIALVAQLPALAGMGVWQPVWIYLIPTFPPLQLLIGAFRPLETWELVYGLVGSIAFTALFYFWSERAFDRHIMNKV